MAEGRGGEQDAGQEKSAADKARERAEKQAEKEAARLLKEKVINVDTWPDGTMQNMIQ